MRGPDIRPAGYVRRAIHELERALRDRITEAKPGDAAEAIAAELQACTPWLTRTLLEHLPTLAHPWRVVDMRHGEPTKLVRDGYGDTIAAVWRYRRGKLTTWWARVGDALIEPEGSESVTWSALKEAQAACDARLRESGVTIVDGGE